jgi:ubiquinone biosynthesis O-methyltransferase
LSRPRPNKTEKTDPETVPATTEAPVPIGSAAYDRWRATRLGAITESLETQVILDLARNLAERRVLDIGCGDGALACLAAARGAEVTGIDSDSTMLSVARSRAETAGLQVRFLEGRIERLPFPPASFDLVFAITVLCFVDDAFGAVRELARVLRPGGCLVIGELGRHSLWAMIRRVKGWLGAATWKAARFRTASELRHLAVQSGLNVGEIRGAIYYPPVERIAHMLAPFDPWLGRRILFGAAFIALRATASENRRDDACAAAHV